MELKLIVKEKGEVVAVTPTGEEFPLLVYVHDSAYNGIVFIQQSNKTNADKGETK